MPRPSLDEIYNSTQKRPSLDEIYSQTANKQPPKTDSMMSQGLGYVKEHPYKTALQPIAQTITGKSLTDTSADAYRSGTEPLVKKIEQNTPQIIGETARLLQKKGTSNVAETVGNAEGVTSPAAVVGGALLNKFGGPIANKAMGGIKKAGSFLKVDNVNENIVPKAYQAFQENVNKFTPEIQQWAEKTLKIPKSALETVKRSGIEKIQQIRDAHGDSTDPIIQKLDAGFAQREKAVEDAYSAAFQDGKGESTTVIPVKRTKNAMGSLLRRAGYLDKNNKPTLMAENDTSENSALKNVMGFYQSLGTGDGQVTAVTPFQWRIFRSNLSKVARGDKELSREVTGILDSLHEDAEKAGIKGIQNARGLARQKFDAEENLSRTLLKEGKLDKFHKLTFAEKRQLSDIENYTGVKFMDDLEHLAAGPHVDKLLEYNPGKFADDMAKAVNPTQTMRVMREYQPLLGSKTKDILRMIRAEQAKRGAATIVGGGLILKGGDVAGKAIKSMTGH